MFFHKKIKLTAAQRDAILSQSNTMTPDVVRLEQYDSQLLFVTDEWKRCGRNWHILQKELDAKIQCTAFTRHHYRFLVHTGFFHPEHKPLVLETLWKDGYKIEGELFSIPNPDQSFQLLDRLKLNTVECFRKRVDILYPYRKQWTDQQRTQPGTYLRDRGGSYGYTWDGTFPDTHPLAGVKTFITEETVYILRAWMYIAKPDWWKRIHKHPEQYDEVPRVPSEPVRRWVSAYYSYDKPKDY